MQLHGQVAEQYANFAVEARGSSDCFAAWADAVAHDPEVLAWLGDLPPAKRQPNLVFAAARWHGVPAPGPYEQLRDALLGDDGGIRTTILQRSTQTNEVGRLATLLPAMALIPGPLALVEIGASAGLCLYPDRWNYEWSPVGSLMGCGGPTLQCAVDGRLPVPQAHPVVARRAGVDLNPLDVNDEEAIAWLSQLVWPEQAARRARLEQATAIARRDPPHLERGDLLAELPRLVAAVGKYGTPVVFHSAVIAYLSRDERDVFEEMVRGLVAEGACHWISNEGEGVLPDVTATGPEVPRDRVTFVLGLDGQALAWTHPHGASMTWLGP